ncbi:MAG: AMP-binding protein [Acidimicrobiaceae bacterium]|nr:AMP-binding protein [Acidimicrobiaceae bacterium]
MSKLVALRVNQGPDIPSLISEVWGSGDAISVIDMRLDRKLQERQIQALQPDYIYDERGNLTKTGFNSKLKPGAALVITTSGTTSNPKAVVHTMENLRTSALAISSRLSTTTNDHWICSLPISHIGGMSVITRSLLTNTAVTVLEKPTPQAITGAAAAGGNLISIVLAMMDRIDLSQFKKVLLGAQNPPSNLAANVVTTYGMTETGSGVFYNGRPLDGVEFKLTDAGEVLIKGPMLATTYRDGRPILDDDGWLHTDDFATVGPNGSLEVRGRITEIINTGGEKVFPFEVESEILKSQKVADCAVIAMPDQKWGEAVIAVLVPKDPTDPPTLGEVTELTRGALPPWYSPKQIILVGSIPRTPLGKPQRRLLAQELLSLGHGRKD